jgi:hypothetical protein
MGNLDDTLNRHAKRLGIEKQVEAVGVVEKATEVIAKYIPREDFEVISFKDKKIKICPSSASAASQILLTDSQIKKDLYKDKIIVNRILVTFQRNDKA